MASSILLSGGEEENPGARTRSTTRRVGGEKGIERQTHRAIYYPSRHAGHGTKAIQNRSRPGLAKRASRGAIRQQMAAGAEVESQERH